MFPIKVYKQVKTIRSGHYGIGCCSNNWVKQTICGDYGCRGTDGGMHFTVGNVGGAYK